MRAVWTFVTEVYAPGLHLAFAAGWFLALQAALIMLDGTQRPWRLDIGPVVGIITLFLVLFFLRGVDEWKDLDYDRVHHPNRPLVRGVLTHRQLALALGFTALIAVALNAWLSITPALVITLDMVWAVALVGVEQVSRRVRDGMLLNLVVTYPVNVALSVYTYALLLDRQGGTPTWRGSLVVVAFALAFLYYEIARKTVWPRAARPGERLYSLSLGGIGSIACAFACAAGAALILLVLLSTTAAGDAPLRWLALLPLVPATMSLVAFLRQPGRRIKLAPLGQMFLTVFYLSLAVQAVARQ